MRDSDVESNVNLRNKTLLLLGFTVALSWLGFEVYM